MNGASQAMLPAVMKPASKKILHENGGLLTLKTTNMKNLLAL